MISADIRVDHADGSVQCCLVEVDCGTLTLARFRKKARAFELCWETGLFRRVFGQDAFEVLVLNNAIKDAIHARVSAGEIRRLAAEASMISLRDDAALKIQLGLTTPEEALRAVYLEGD